MYKKNEKYIFSPSDLTRFMESPFASWMDRYTMEYPHLAPAKDQADALVDSLQKRGFAHEDQLEVEFREQGLSVVKIEAENVEEKHKATVSAINRGDDVIVQGYLESDEFAGFADFLVKVEGSSALGDFHYEVWDTKLAKQLKPTNMIQLCCYAEMLEAIQDIRPKQITVALGNGEKKALRTNDYFHYYRCLKRAFLSAQLSFDSNNMLDPSDSKSWGNWSTYAKQLLTERDHLFQVANITRGQIKKMKQVNVLTMQQLVETEIERTPGMSSSILQRLKKQATIQKASADQTPPLYEIKFFQEGGKQGLSLLPPASLLDVFFDIEGFPLMEGGLEYLWGCTYFNSSGNRDFQDFWAHDREREKEAFQGFIKWVYERWQRDPSMHIYHYANYEIAACRKLMGRFGVCEEEVDQLLRNEVFVDLYNIVKGGILLGEPRYSIKNVEHLYRGKRETEVGSGGDSVVAYEEWRERHDRGEEGSTWGESKILHDIRNYNKDDCESTQELVDWLRARQKEHSIDYLGKTELYVPPVNEEIIARVQLRDRLLAKAKQQLESNPKLAALSENLAWMLEFHRRESKPVFWRLFDRLGFSSEELRDDPDCLAFCVRTKREPFKCSPKDINLAYEYSFDPNQEFKGAGNIFCLFGEENEKGKTAKVTYVPEHSDLENGLIAVKSKKEQKATISLVPADHFNFDTISQSIDQVVAEYESGKLQRCAILNFLTRSKPVIKGQNEGPIISSNDPKERLDQIIQAVKNLDSSYLTIQGPPGSGKSYTGKHVIAELVKGGCKVGISSNSHKAINKLLLDTARHCNELGIQVSFICAKATEDALTEIGVSIVKNDKLVGYIKPGCVLGTTAWGYARDDMVKQLDYLFIDEAGQVSVANLIAMSRCTKNLVLMGDQMQLGQPTQGSHPAESGLSILDYLLHDAPTISDEMGVFLGTTYRMHPAVNDFISEHIYEGKLESHPANEKRIIEVPEGYQGKLNKEAGIIYVPVQHEGNIQASDEEVSEIKMLTQDLLGRSLITREGERRKIGWDDILFVTPYNHQSRKLKEALGKDAKVGSVDKFQGQEAPIVILSMCASDASESPRGLEFLFDRNRINVAISRAESLAIVVGSPTLENTIVTRVDQLKLVNLFNALCSNSIR